jgi:aspartate/methionine/tyrosine aminotransferase
MKLDDVNLEVFFDKHEFNAPYLLTQSDCESMSIKTLLAYEPNGEQEFLNSWLGYTQGRGNPELCEEISKLYTSLSGGNVVVHVGAQEAIFNFMNVLLDEKDHVITLCPAYQSLFEVASAIGCKVSPWNLQQGETGWELDMALLGDMIQPNTKLICINTPNNPTGYTMNREEMDQITDIARHHGIYVFSDEVYKGLELFGQKSQGFADIYEKAISLGVMSKAYGLAGLRIGWVASQDQDLFEKMLKFKHYTTICSSAPSEFLARVALCHGDKILGQNRSIIQKNLEISDIFFKTYPDFFMYNRPMAGPVGFHRMNLDQPIEEFCDQMVAEKGVLLLPANIYSFRGNYFRMGYGRKNFQANLGHFEEYLKEKHFI